MKKLIITIGMPFSGKSTLADTYRSKEGWKVIARDDIIPTITSSKEWNERVVRACAEEGVDPSNLKANFPIRNRVTLEMLNDTIAKISFFPVRLRRGFMCHKESLKTFGFQIY